MNTKHREVKRRDATGHLDPEYQRKLLESSGKGDGGEESAFLDENAAPEPLAQELGQAFLEAATSGEETEPDRQDEVDEEENGGPFIVTSASQEFASGTDESNIAEATREPLPKTSRADP